MKPESSSPYSQEPATCFYPEPDRSQLKVSEKYRSEIGSVAL
jgi:hypothetical protein